jgi:hypothetical protein
VVRRHGAQRALHGHARHRGRRRAQAPLPGVGGRLPRPRVGRRAAAGARAPPELRALWVHGEARRGERGAARRGPAQPVPPPRPRPHARLPTAAALRRRVLPGLRRPRRRQRERAHPRHGRRRGARLPPGRLGAAGLARARGPASTPPERPGVPLG